MGVGRVLVRIERATVGGGVSDAVRKMPSLEVAVGVHDRAGLPHDQREGEKDS